VSSMTSIAFFLALRSSPMLVMGVVLWRVISMSIGRAWPQITKRYYAGLEETAKPYRFDNR